MDGLYGKLVEEAAERASDTGVADLVDLAEAASCGFDMTTFANDVSVAVETSINETTQGA